MDHRYTAKDRQWHMVRGLSWRLEGRPRKSSVVEATFKLNTEKKL